MKKQVQAVCRVLRGSVSRLRRAPNQDFPMLTNYEFTSRIASTKEISTGFFCLEYFIKIPIDQKWKFRVIFFLLFSFRLSCCARLNHSKQATKGAISFQFQIGNNLGTRHFKCNSNKIITDKQFICIFSVILQYRYDNRRNFFNI